MPHSAYLHAIEDIYSTGYYTNHGPQAQKLEDSLQLYFRVPHVVVTGNESLALIIALAGLPDGGPMGVSEDCPALVLDAAQWAGRRVVPCHGAEPPDGLGGLLLCDREKLAPNSSLVAHAQRAKLPIIVYRAGRMTRIAPSGLDQGDVNVITILRVAADTAERSAACAAILTADAVLAERCRNIRSSYGARQVIDVTATANGRVSELQAGLALAVLKDFERGAST